MLDANAITTEAEAQVGVSDPGPASFRSNLEVLVDALNVEAGLSEGGEGRVRDSLVSRVVERISAAKWVGEHPEISDEPISNPVFLTGLPRSGTTFFQYLFDNDPRFRLIRSWEARSPLPPPGYDPASVASRVADEIELRRARGIMVKGFEAMHLSDPSGPEECHAFLEQTCSSAGFQNLYDVPSHFEHLLTEVDFRAVYEAHKRQLQLLQWRGQRTRWALKYPNHVLAMPAIRAVYPDARFVMTHRDPVQTLASICKLTSTVRGATSASPVDPHHVGRQMLHFVRRHIDRILEFDETADGGEVVHVDYYRLVDDPGSVMREVHAALGLADRGDVLLAVQGWHERNPKGARGSNPYALETFGLDGGEVAELFDDYMQRFDVPREQAGLARAPA